jgi:hypothetical protein
VLAVQKTSPCGSSQVIEFASENWVVPPFRKQMFLERPEGSMQNFRS